ncbi:MAG: TonB-dependent receptor [Myxococcaceae bacterium]|nr:TonB-dependent receptor [Myxococcaceae bacterium]
MDGPAQHETTVRERRLSRSASELTITQDVVQAAPRSGATDLLRLVPGLVASQHSGEGKAHQLFLRGFDAVHGQDVELNVAGVPVNEVSHLHALGYADLNWLIPDAVREVRVTEGSSRAWQGDFAVAGTVRYELGLEERGVTVATSFGSFNRARVFLGVRPFDAPDTFAAAELVRGDGFGARRAFRRASALGQVVVPLDGVRLRLFVGSAAGAFESPGVVRDDANVAGRADFFDAFGAHQGGASSRHQALLGVELRHDTGRTLVEAFGALSELSLRNNFTGFTSGAEGDGLEQRQRDGLVGGRVEHHRHLTLWGHTFSLDLGLGVRRDGITQSQRSYRESDGDALAPTIDAQVTQTAGNAWTELSLAPGPWRFLLGGRADALGFDVVDLRGRRPRVGAFGVHWGLKAGVERRLGERVRLFANYGDGFRSPQARSLADGEVAPFVSVRSAELGASLELPRVVTRLVLFGSHVANDVFFDHTVGTTVSLGPSLRGGASLVVTARPLDGWVLTGSFTGAHARVATSGALLPYFAPLVGRLDTGYSRDVTLGAHRFTGRVGTGLTLIGARPLPFGDFSRAVFLADARASVRWQAIELVFDVQNVFDARWRDGEFTYASRWEPDRSSQLPARHFTAGAPRTFTLTLELHL